MKTFKMTMTLLLTFGMLSFVLVQFAQAEGKDGKTIFEESKCTTCHGIESQGVAAKKKSDKNPDLSKITTGHDIDFWTKYMKKDEVLNSKKHPIAFKGTDEELKIMMEWLMSLSAE